MNASTKLDPLKLDRATRLAYTNAADKIVALWVEVCGGTQSRFTPADRKSVSDWLRAASEDSTVMHDNCDANMLFDEVLRDVGLIDDEMLSGIPDYDVAPSVESQRQTAVWNDVTFTYGLLEAAAERALAKSEVR